MPVPLSINVAHRRRSRKKKIRASYCQRQVSQFYVLDCGTNMQYQKNLGANSSKFLS